MEHLSSISVLVSQDEFENPPAANDEFLHIDEYTVVYVQMKDGSLKMRRRIRGGRVVVKAVKRLPSKPGAVTTQVATVQKNPRSDLLKDNLNLLPAGRIPGQFLWQVIAFFKSVMDDKLSAVAEVNTAGHHARTQSAAAAYRHEYEAMAHIIYNTNTKEYRVGIPTQRVSKAAVSYDRDSYDEQAGDIMVVDIHSHNTMGAFFSGTDNNDDQHAFCYSGVVGNLDRPSPSTIFRLNIADEKFEAKADEIFDFSVPLPAVPPEWLAKVTVQTYGGVGTGYENWGGYYANRGGTHGSNVRPFRHGQEVGGTSQKKLGSGAGKSFLDSAYSAATLPAIDPDTCTEEQRVALVSILGEKLSKELGFDTPRAVVEADTGSLTDLMDEEAMLEFFFGGATAGDTTDPSNPNLVWAPGAEFTSLVKLMFTLTEINTEQYTTLRNLRVYEVIVDELAGVYEAGTDDRGQKYFVNAHKGGKDGIRTLARAFVANEPGLVSYVHYHAIPGNFTIDKFAEDVWELLFDMGQGLVY